MSSHKRACIACIPRKVFPFQHTELGSSVQNMDGDKICSRGVGKHCPRTWPWSTSDKKKTAQVKVSLTEDQLKGLFTRYDINQDGRLSNQELKDALQSLGSRFPAWRAWRVLRHADVNGDGFINEDEFQGLVNYMSKHGYVKK